MNSGNTMVVEHNLDIIKSADWIIGLGCQRSSEVPPSTII
jgi:excinuclease UvrABC ATPase subunit